MGFDSWAGIVQGSLFTRDFLLEGIADTEAWKALGAEEIETFRKAITAKFAEFPVNGKPNEAQTEDDLIVPVLKALGWTQYLRQQTSSKRREDIPDILLFGDAEAKRRANAERSERRRYRHGLAITESKAWALPLDRGAPDLFNQDAPSSQMLRYLTSVENASERSIKWGILTNGRLWRLYFQGAKSRSEEFLGLDLAVLANVVGLQPELGAEEVEKRDHLLKVFILLFRRSSFGPGAEDRRTFHQIALSLTQEWEAQVSEDLSKVVFDHVFPQLVNAVVKGDPTAPKKLDATYLDTARHAALTLLYRLLFVLYAEDRNLLPSHERGYEDYSLRKLRAELQERIERGGTYSRATSMWDRLKTIFKLIDEGDPAIGLPPYNGGLFDPRQHTLLTRTQLSDAAVGPVLDLLSRRRGREGESPKRINYRDLSVQHLGSIYERLLEYVVIIKNGGTVVQLNPFARKGSGSYYTHEDLVGVIIQRTIGPLVEERHAAFTAKSKALASSKGPINKRIEELSRLDPAAALLELKICDPAMGSGHFLVSLVDYLADKILEAMGVQVDWADQRLPYKSPLIARVGIIRQRIRDEARTNNWKVDDNHLDDRHIVRRMILKRCVYGVDKNPVAVELAQLSLWLHTFTVGAPLSFLDHHLRCGDSLFGEWVRPIEDMLVQRGGMFLNPSVAKAKNSAKGMLAIETLTDADIAEVRTSATMFAGVEEATAPLARFMDLVHALKWIEPADKNEEGTIEGFFDGQFGDPVAIASGTTNPRGKDAEVLSRLVAKARAVVDEQRFLHWEVAFPGVWTDWESHEPAGGFDAVIGNPPWDRIKLQDIEWFAARRPQIALLEKAADRKKAISSLEAMHDPLWSEYKLAAGRAEAAARVAREAGQFPLLARGDIDIYALFVERAQRLLKPNGISGLLVPSGIASDLNTSDFFRLIAGNGHLGGLFDFWNKRSDDRNFFPDVYYRFKFCVFITGGHERTFPTTVCAFYLRTVNDLNNPERAFPMSAQDFLNVNPNTGTAPIFRTRRDAQLTTQLHSHFSVLVDRRHKPPQKVWPLTYKTMFHMANDSSLFKSREQLEHDGFYAVVGGHMRRGTDEFVPLYEGKMVQAFDHRAADIVIAKRNLFRPGQTDQTTVIEHSDPAFVASPRYYVDAKACLWPGELNWALAFKDITSVTNTRTMIAALIPFCGAGHTLPILFPEIDKAGEAAEARVKDYKRFVPLLAANLNSFALDFLARQKVQGNHLTWFIIEQLPLLPPKVFEKKIGKTIISDFVRREVLSLTYTAHDMSPFARDMGYEGAPFAWDEEDRQHRRARLDALFFRLYGIDEDDATYILETFPIVREQDQAAFGRYLTKDLVLAYMRAVAAGDLASFVSK